MKQKRHKLFSVPAHKMPGLPKVEERPVNKLKMASRRRAVTLTELLVVLAILSLLATLAVPVYVQKTEQARRSIARAEVRAIAEAQEQVALTHGYYVPIHFLNNLPNNPSDTQNRDDFDNYPAGARSNIQFIDPFRSLEQQRLAGGQDTFLDALAGRTRAAQMINFWSGPFLNPARVATNPALDPDNQQNLSFDLVLDPWGRPYIFYSPIGAVWSFNSMQDLNTFDPTDGNRTDWDSGRLSIVDNRFDRYAIVSFGANGISDSFTTGTNAFRDDIIYTFGFTPNETAFANF